MRRLLLLPGLGADRRLFEPQRACAADIEVIEWIEPAAAESLAGYAQRLAASIDTTRPFALGGASFGGMVALEIARHVRPAAVILIGSCRAPSQLPRYYRPLRGLAGVATLLPLRLAAWRFGIRTKQDRQLFAAMLRATPRPFVRWAARAIFGWRGATDLDVPVHHIHGGRDRIIPPAAVNADAIVAEGGHFLGVTHAAEVNAFIDSVMRRYPIT